MESLRDPLSRSHNLQGVIFRVSDTLYSGRHLIWVSDTLKIEEKGLGLIHGVIIYGVRHQHTWGLLRESLRVSDTKSN